MVRAYVCVCVRAAAATKAPQMCILHIVFHSVGRRLHDSNILRLHWNYIMRDRRFMPGFVYLFIINYLPILLFICFPSPHLPSSRSSLSLSPSRLLECVWCGNIPDPLWEWEWDGVRGLHVARENGPNAPNQINTNRITKKGNVCARRMRLMGGIWDIAYLDVCVCVCLYIYRDIERLARIK